MALTLVLPFYRNRGMLVEHQRVWASYPEPLRRALHVIVVDDGSPAGTEATADLMTLTDLGSFRLYRVKTDVRWNWLTCRNIGVDQATTDWVLLTDIDHVMPVETMQALHGRKLDSACVYRLARVDAPRPWPYTLAECPVREKKRFHPNTWLMTKRMYTERVGGYDERLSGCYGTDGEFRDRVQTNARSIVCLTDVLIRYGREILPDASTSPDVFTRKNDPENDAELKRRRESRALVPGWKPLRLTFPYERVA